MAGAFLMVLGLLTSLLAFLAPPAAAVVVGTDPSGGQTGFEIEGDQDDDAFAAIDWENVLSTATIVRDDTLDSGLAGSSKENDPSEWVCNTGGANPGKANILAAAVNARFTASAAFLDLAYAREVGLGDSHVNFEFNQNATTYTCPGFGLRTTGDILLAFDFPGGSDAPNIEGFEWNANLSADGEWVPIGNFPPGAAAGSSNAGPTADLMFGAPVPSTMPARTFGEISLDLAVIFPDLFEGPCRNFGTLNVRSRSSGESFNSALQDRLAPTPIDLSTCGQIIIHKIDNAGNDLAGATFGLYGSLTDAQNRTNELDTCVSEADGTCTFSEVSPGTYFIAEISAPAGYDPDPDIVEVTVEARQTVDVAEPFVNELPITIDVTKDANPTEIDEPGGPVTFSVSLHNTSLEPLTITSLTDNVFGDITAVQGDISATTCVTGTVLAPDATYSCTFTATVTGNAGDVHVDTVTGNAQDNEGNTATDVDDATVTIEDVPPVVTVLKGPNPDSLPETGGDVTYTVEVTNTSFESVTITELSDDIFGTLAGDGDCQVGTILAANGGTCSFEFTETLAGQEPGTTHTNIVTTTVVDDDGSTDTDSDDAVVTFVDVAPVITVDKTANPTSVPESGGNVIYTVVVTNDSAESVTITSLQDDQFGTLDGDGDCQVGTVLAANGGSCSFEFVEPLAQDAGTSHTNIATACAEDNDESVDCDDDDATVEFTDVAPTVEIIKTANPTVIPEETATDVTFTFVVTNTSFEEVTITSLDDTVFGPLGGDGDCQVGTVLAPSGEAGDSCTFELVVELEGNASGDPHNNVVTVCVEDNDGSDDCDDDDETVTFDDVLPTISVIKDADPTSMDEPGGDVDFTVTVTNDSVEPVEITSLTDDIFGTLAGDEDCQVGTILAANGGSCEFTFTEEVTGNAGFVHVNTATAVAVDDEDNEASASDDATVTLQNVGSSIEVTKTADPVAVPEPGADVDFTVVIENTSAVDTITIDSITDDVFGDLGDAGNTLVDDNTCPALIGDELAPGESTSCTFVAFIGADGDVSALDEHHDTVTVDGTDDDDLPVTDSDDAVVDVTDVAPVINIVKSTNVTSVVSGTPVVYNYDVSTPGIEELINVEVTDDKCADVTFVDGDTDGDDRLDPGETWRFTCTATLTATTTNIATVCAEDDEGTEACDDDTVTVTVAPVEVLPQVIQRAQPQALPRTGSEAQHQLVLGLGIALMGAGLMLYDRSRRRHLAW